MVSNRGLNTPVQPRQALDFSEWAARVPNYDLLIKSQVKAKIHGRGKVGRNSN